MNRRAFLKQSLAMMLACSAPQSVLAQSNPYAVAFAKCVDPSERLDVVSRAFLEEGWSILDASTIDTAVNIVAQHRTLQAFNAGRPVSEAAEAMDHFVGQTGDLYAGFLADGFPAETASGIKLLVVTAMQGQVVGVISTDEFFSISCQIHGADSAPSSLVPGDVGLAEAGSTDFLTFSLGTLPNDTATATEVNLLEFSQLGRDALGMTGRDVPFILSVIAQN